MSDHWTFDPWPQQSEVLDAPERILVAGTGRRWGTSSVAGRWAFEEAWRTQGMVWHVSPDSRHRWQALERSANQLAAAAIELQICERISLAGGGSVAFLSADRPEDLRGPAPAAIVVEHPGYIEHSFRSEILKPLLATAPSLRLLLIGTPPAERDAWFHEVWLAAGVGDVHRRWEFPMSSNPFISADEIDRLRQRLAEEGRDQYAIAREVDGRFAYPKKTEEPADGIHA